MSEQKTEREQLEMDLHKAFAALADYFKAKDDPLYYKVNRLWRQFDDLRNIPESPKPKKL